MRAEQTEKHFLQAPTNRSTDGFQANENGGLTPDSNLRNVCLTWTGQWNAQDGDRIVAMMKDATPRIVK